MPFLNTLILLGRGVTVTVSHFYLNEGSKFLFSLYLFLTFLLGATFTFFQAQEYISSFFCIRDGNFGTSFFMLTGFHGIHVLIGSIFLIVTLFYALYLHNSKFNFLRFELAC